MKKDDIGDQGFEKVLKDKMNELSDSVDCFGKISARAFPDKDSVFTESGFTVSETENITGRSSAPKLIKWAALSAALVLAAVFIPKTGVVQRLYSDLSGSVQKDFRNILTEIETETTQHDYRQIDMPLSRYSANDLLVTPFFACPFEDTGRSGMNVRIYIRQTGAGQSGSFDTAQVYAVEYEDEYSEENIIAAAQSAYTFTDKDLENVSVSQYSNTEFSEAVWAYFNTSEDSDMLLDSEGEEVSAASFACGCYFKSDEGAEYLTSDVVYWQRNGDVSVCFYDMTDPLKDDELVFDENARAQMWKKSVYFNGNSAFPIKSGSRYKRTDILTSYASEQKSGDIAYIQAFDPYKTDIGSIEEGGTLEVQRSDLKRTLSRVNVPFDKELLSGVKIYFPLKCSSADTLLLYNGKKLQEDADTEMFEEQAKNIKDMEKEIMEETARFNEEAYKTIEEEQRQKASESALQE